MEILNVKNLSFIYASGTNKVLDNIDLQVNTGGFYLLCGTSGCGKSTLLRQFKPTITPTGMRSGKISYLGENIDDLSDRQLAKEIGFVFQDPDTQIVTDTVRSELAFSLESLGMSPSQMALKVGEMATFFGLEKDLDRKCDTLSGGEKQLLNLASTMALNPRLLILDEPTSQLDPLAASEFLNTLVRINRDLGTTIIISEHHLQEIFSLVDQVIVMEAGGIIAIDSPENIKVSENLRLGLPAALQISSQVDHDLEKKPLTASAGQKWLEEIMVARNIEDLFLPSEFVQLTPETKLNKEENAIELSHIFFRYSRDSKDVLKDASIAIPKGKITAIVGGNGTGKSTCLRVMSGAIPAYDGKIFINGKPCKKEKDFPLGENGLVYLPQNPKALFTGITVDEELEDAALLEKIGLSGFKESHPYDLSGGQAQKLAIAKLLNIKPKIMLLDEPTKGLDPLAKNELGLMLRQLLEDDITIVLVSHDLDFVAEFADFATLCFDGQLVGFNEKHKFFSENNFYTTSANRIARKYFKNSITVGEVVNGIKS